MVNPNIDILLINFEILANFRAGEILEPSIYTRLLCVTWSNLLWQFGPVNPGLHVHW